MRTTGSEGGIVAIKCIDPEDWLDSIPPLGTVDEDGNPTSEAVGDELVTCDAGTYKKTQAVKGDFELIYGKAVFNQTDDEESSENNDINIGRDKTKGYENITGTLEFSQLEDRYRLEGAVKGGWDYTTRRYYRHKQFRMYEILALQNPNTPSLAASSAELCQRLIGVKLERRDIDRSQPNGIKIPIFVMRMDEFPQWSQATAQTLFTAPKTFTASTNYSVDTAIQYRKIIHTRLKINIVATTWGVITIRGLDAFGRAISESIDMTSSKPATYITKNYFASVDASGVRFGPGWAGTTLTIQLTEYDAKFIPA